MTRFAATSKMLWYPTPPRICDLIAQTVTGSVPTGPLLDPCAGEGEAATILGAAWGAEPYGVELDKDRAKIAAKRMKCKHGSYHQLDAPEQSFGVLFLNPPYAPGKEADNESRRQEVQFLQDTVKYLAPGGLLIFIPPHHILDNEKFRMLMNRAFCHTTTFAFPSPERDAFDQVVVFGIRNEERGYPTYGGWCTPKHPPDLGTGTFSYPPYYRPALVKLTHFKVHGFAPESIAPTRETGAYATPKWRMIMGSATDGTVKPLSALRPGHQAMLLAAGCLDGIDLAPGVILKGSSEKIVDTRDDEEADTRVERERIVSRISTLDVNTGTFESFRTDEGHEQIQAWFDTHGDTLGKAVKTAMPPAFDGDLSLYDFTNIKAPGVLPGEESAHLLEVQKATAAAVAFRWKSHKSAVISGEMGVGKTGCAIAACALSRHRKVIVICPGHLVKKWIREIGAMTGQIAVTARSLSDVDAFFKGGTVWLVLSKETAKLGARWRGAAVPTRFRVMHDEKMEHIPALACPQCGRMVMKGEMPAYQSDLDARKCKCDHCGEALWQSTAITSKGTKRWALARYINRRYGNRYALVADECHQYSRADSDQARAAQHLASTCTKLLAMTGTIYGGRASSIFHLCIAAGSPVLTDRGLVPIENIRGSDLLWDGIEWVSHEGIICKGKQEVISYQGLTATPAHEVWTEAGRKVPLGRSASERATLARSGKGSVALRVAFSDDTLRHASPHQRPSTSRCRMWDLQETEDLLRRQYLAQNNAGLCLSTQSEVWQRSQGEDALDQIQLHDAAMSPRFAQEECILQGSRDRSAFRIIGALRSLGAGEVAALNVQGTSLRSDRQLRALRAGESSLGDASGELTKQPQTAIVYDVLNAGPRRRFTCCDVLVSNCFKSDHRFRDLYRYDACSQFVEHFGLSERTYELSKVSTSHYGYKRGNAGARVREIPGAHPGMLRLLLEYTIFVRLADLGYQLPAYTEHVEIVDHDPVVLKAAQDLQRDVKSVLREYPEVLSQYLMATLGYPDCPAHEEHIIAFDEDTGSKVEIASAPSIPGACWPKDQRLIDIVTAEKAAGRKVLVFFTQTHKRDPQPRVQTALEQAGFSTAILRGNVEPGNREEWVNDAMGDGNGFDVLLTNGRLVETGLDLLWAQTIISFQAEYSIPTLRQSTRRSWRLGQTQPVKVIYLAYRGTMQEPAMTLIAQKMRAAEMIDGEAAGGLAQHDTGNDDFFLELARLSVGFTFSAKPAPVLIGSALAGNGQRSATVPSAYVATGQVNGHAIVTTFRALNVGDAFRFPTDRPGTVRTKEAPKRYRSGGRLLRAGEGTAVVRV